MRPGVPGLVSTNLPDVSDSRIQADTCKHLLVRNLHVAQCSKHEAVSLGTAGADSACQEDRRVRQQGPVLQWLARNCNVNSEDGALRAA